VEVLENSGRVSRGIPNCSISVMNKPNQLIDKLLHVVCSEISLEVLEIFEDCNLFEKDDQGNILLKEEHRDDYEMLYNTFEFTIQSILNGNLVNPKTIDTDTWRLTNE
tara:strand:+ start:1283 stop:1606 length:324 start_codon:yes stop_codon:yes gene_type:complete